MVRLTLGHVEIKGGSVMRGEVTGGAVLEASTREELWKVFITERFRYFGKPVFGRVSGPMIFRRRWDFVSVLMRTRFRALAYKKKGEVKS